MGTAEAIVRHSRSYWSIQLTADLATTPELNFAEWSSGQVSVPAGSGITALVFYAAARTQVNPNIVADNSVPGESSSAGYVEVADPANPINVTAGSSYPFLLACAGAGAIKIVAVGADGPVDVSLKS